MPHGELFVQSFFFLKSFMLCSALGLLSVVPCMSPLFSRCTTFKLSVSIVNGQVVLLHLSRRLNIVPCFSGMPTLLVPYRTHHAQVPLRGQNIADRANPIFCVPSSFFHCAITYPQLCSVSSHSQRALLKRRYCDSPHQHSFLYLSVLIGCGCGLLFGFPAVFSCAQRIHTTCASFSATRVLIANTWCLNDLAGTKLVSVSVLAPALTWAFLNSSICAIVTHLCSISFGLPFLLLPSLQQLKSLTSWPKRKQAKWREQKGTCW